MSGSEVFAIPKKKRKVWGKKNKRETRSGVKKRSQMRVPIKTGECSEERHIKTPETSYTKKSID